MWIGCLGDLLSSSICIGSFLLIFISEVKFSSNKAWQVPIEVSTFSVTWKQLHITPWNRCSTTHCLFHHHTSQNHSSQILHYHVLTTKNMRKHWMDDNLLINTTPYTMIGYCTKFWMSQQFVYTRLNWLFVTSFHL